MQVPLKYALAFTLISLALIPSMAAPTATYLVETTDGKPAGTIILELVLMAEPLSAEEMKDKNSPGKFDAIVNAANEPYTGGGGIDEAIHKAAGPELKAFNLTIKPVGELSDKSEAKKCIDGTTDKTCRCPTGEARVSPSYGKLLDHKIKYVLGTAGPRGTFAQKERLIESSFYQTIALATEINSRVTGKDVHITTPSEAWKQNLSLFTPKQIETPIISIAFPFISAAIFGYPIKDSAPYIACGIIHGMRDYARQLKNTKSSLEPFTIYIVGLPSDHPLGQSGADAARMKDMRNFLDSISSDPAPGSTTTTRIISQDVAQFMAPFRAATGLNELNHGLLTLRASIPPKK